MPTYLSEPAISRAIDHLSKFGDTDVFPHFVEIVFLNEMKDRVVEEIAQLDLDNFSPTQAVETISPKSRYGFRIVHQTHFLETLLPFVKELVLYLHALEAGMAGDLPEELRNLILLQMTKGAAATVPAIRVWLLELFVRQVFFISNVELNAIGLTESLENRQMYLIKGVNRDVNFFRRQKTRFDERNYFEKTAFILGATCLPKDEFETWVGAIRPNMTRPLERLFCDWAKSKSGQLFEILQKRLQLLRD